MDDTKLIKDQQIDEIEKMNNILINSLLPRISLPNQDGNFLQLNRSDTFRLVIYFFSMTGHPNKNLPKNWNFISGAKGCTLENCNFRDNYEKFISFNALPIGISSQSIEDLKEMTNRLRIQHDVLSDSNLLCANELTLPTFSVEDRTFIKRLTIVVEKNIIKKVFYPILSVNKHIENILEWLKVN
tara:strand:- start:194 stop:748 length:555 start_codon:yes stop_codon:yes gene_type:complete